MRHEKDSLKSQFEINHGYEWLLWHMNIAGVCNYFIFSINED